ncbi:MAG: hypothetical protein ABIS50_13835 [Luteolibacter sp.]|uniref:hypothetical protein n=1 Tax=Luteolibacter sp. TaxID=1962973 RepID=UPI00326785E5
MDSVSFIQAFLVVLMMVTGCVVIGIATGYPAAHWIGRKFAELLSCLPTEKFAKAQPAYGIPASKAIRGDLEGAMESYEQLLLDHPQEKQIYLRMLEIAFGPLHAPEYGEDILQRGLKNLTGEADRAALYHLSLAIQNGEFTPFKYLDHAQVAVPG